jgi:hypothetical protein
VQDAIEECRKLCGGHGYLNSSGLPELFAVYVPACTYEGDNVVLLLQVCMFLTILVNNYSCGYCFFEREIQQRKPPTLGCGYCYWSSTCGMIDCVPL